MAYSAPSYDFYPPSLPYLQHSFTIVVAHLFSSVHFCRRSRPAGSFLVVLIQRHSNSWVSPPNSQNPTYLDWRVDEEAIGSCTGNMKEVRDQRGGNHISSILSYYNERGHGQMDMATGDHSMAERTSIHASGACDPSRRHKRRAGGLKKSAILVTLLGATPAVMAQSCISLSGSTTCPAFNSASISTDSTLVGLL